MDSLSCGMPARFQKSDEITVNNPHSTPAIGHVQREIAVTLRRNVGHALVKSPVTITRNTQQVRLLDDRQHCTP
jgi:isocitrate dehydrogenase